MPGNFDCVERTSESCLTAASKRPSRNAASYCPHAGATRQLGPRALCPRALCPSASGSGRSGRPANGPVCFDSSQIRAAPSPGQRRLEAASLVTFRGEIGIRVASNRLNEMFPCTPMKRNTKCVRGKSTRFQQAKTHRGSFARDWGEM